MFDELPREIVESDLDQYRSDWWALSLIRSRRGEPDPLPLGALKPRSSEEVAEVLRWASSRQIGVVPRGGGSGVCGGAVPGPDSIVLDLTSMNRILELDDHSLTVSAEAGVYGPDLEAAVGDKGMTLGHVPQSFHISTLGGWISTKATGQTSTLYGGIENRVLGLKAVLSDGTVVASPAFPRASTGPDWWRLFIGAEGTLGVVVEATLSVVSIPAEHAWLEIFFGTGTDAFLRGLDFLRRMIRSGIQPAVVRLYDEADSAFNFGSLGIGGSMAILRFEGSMGLIDEQVKAAMGVLADQGTVIEKGAGEHWWGHRFKAAETYREILSGKGALGPLAVVDTLEVAGTWTQMPGLYREVSEALMAECDAVLTHASHIYPSGANYYFTFLINSASDEAEAETRYRAAWKAGLDATVSARGTISHHHGIGLMKAPWMKSELGSGIEALSRIKAALDPGGRMNPGKLGI